MKKEEIIIGHDFIFANHSNANEIDSVARLFDSKVFLIYEKKKLNLKSPEEMVKVLNISFLYNRIEFQKGKKAILIVEGEDEQLAFEAVKSAIIYNDRDLRLIWNKYFNNKKEENKVYKKKIVVTNTMGIHARPSKAISRISAAFDAEIILKKNYRSSCARSFLGIMTLAAANGEIVEIESVGREAEEALSAMIELFNSKFYEVD